MLKPGGYCDRVQVCERQISPPATQPESSMVLWPVIFIVPLKVWPSV
jgi:hypothetical protein